MNNKLINVALFPKKIKKILYDKSKNNLRLIGNTNISKYYKITIIEFQENKRAWLLTNEIL